LNIFFCEKKHNISSGVCPSAYKAPVKAPALAPEIAFGKIPDSLRAFKAPICAKPLAPPPLRTSPVLYFLFLFAKILKQAVILKQIYKINSLAQIPQNDFNEKKISFHL
jgi:hypothetical protein